MWDCRIFHEMDAIIAASAAVEDSESKEIDLSSFPPDERDQLILALHYLKRKFIENREAVDDFDLDNPFFNDACHKLLTGPNKCNRCGNQQIQSVSVIGRSGVKSLCIPCFIKIL